MPWESWVWIHYHLEASGGISVQEAKSVQNHCICLQNKLHERPLRVDRNAPTLKTSAASAQKCMGNLQQHFMDFFTKPPKPLQRNSVGE